MTSNVVVKKRFHEYFMSTLQMKSLMFVLRFCEYHTNPIQYSNISIWFSGNKSQQCTYLYAYVDELSDVSFSYKLCGSSGSYTCEYVSLNLPRRYQSSLPSRLYWDQKQFSVSNDSFELDFRYSFERWDYRLQLSLPTYTQQSWLALQRLVLYRHLKWKETQFVVVSNEIVLWHFPY